MTKPPACDGCPRVASGKGFVLGVGPADAKLLVLGEQPSADDVKVGVPFQGYVGEELDKGLGGNRRDVYATNIRKCNGPDGESSSLREASIAFCTNEYLSAEFAAHAEVRVLLAVGADALEVVVGRRDITKVHGSTYSRSEVEKMRNVEIRS